MFNCGPISIQLALRVASTVLCNTECFINKSPTFQLDVDGCWFSLHRVNPLYNISRPVQNCWHFADDILKSIFLKENASILIKIPQISLPNGQIPGQIGFKLELVQEVTWHRTDDKLTIWTNDDPLHCCISMYASPGLNELTESSLSIFFIQRGAHWRKSSVTWHYRCMVKYPWSRPNILITPACDLQQI